MENKCNSCFYALMDKDLSAPCAACVGYSNFVKGDLYMTSHASKPLKEAIDDWFKQDHEDRGYLLDKYNVVYNPKHYMLFEEEGIEVRDVIEKLVAKLDKKTGKGEFVYSPLFAPDYVQLMQYLMRFMDKNGVEDLRKARWYLDKMIEVCDEHHV
jgi:hypothetical protein